MENEKKEKREWTKEDDVKMAQSMFNYAEEELEAHMDNMVERAKRLVDDLERQRKYFMEYKTGKADTSLMSRTDTFNSALRTVQNCFNNYDSSDAARRVAKYEKAEALLKVFKGEKVNLW